jgi:hypothetical protein
LIFQGVPWNEHIPSELSSCTPLDTSVGYELAHKDLPHAKPNEPLYKRNLEEFFLNMHKVMATSSCKLKIYAWFQTLTQTFLKTQFNLMIAICVSTAMSRHKHRSNS